MRILIACESSGVIREAFKAKGHDAWSCDLQPTEIEGQHVQGDVLSHLNEVGKDYYDLIIAHPTCTYLANSGVHCMMNKDKTIKDQDRWDKMIMACDFFNAFKGWSKKLCIENPVLHGYAKSRVGDYTQTIQPWQFGEAASKRTCLWLYGLPKLEPTNVIKKKRYANQTPSGQNKLGPSPDRWKLRSKTYQGIADAMADQWG